MTKKERRTKQLEHHYKTLNRFALFIGAKNTDGKKLSLKLLRLEHEAHLWAERYCNGTHGMTTQSWETMTTALKFKVLEIFNVDVIAGLFINGDARGYALKIDDTVVRNHYNDIGLYRDMGGYGILSPEITGE